MPRRKRRIELKLHIRLHTSFQIRSGYSGAGLNQTMVSDRHGQLFIPASSLKGRIKFYAGQFASIMTGLSGTGSWNEGWRTRLFGDEKQRGGLFFEHALLEDQWLEADTGGKEISEQNRRRGLAWQRERRSGIRVDRMVGSVADKALRFYETSAPRLGFHCTIEGALPMGAEAWTAPDLCLLFGAVRLCRKLGAEKSRGQGQAEIKPISLTIDPGPNAETFQGTEMKALLGDCYRNLMGVAL